MPLINKIEVSNFLHSRTGSGSKWQPVWPHSVFDLMGLNSIINFPNGKGKTTIVNTLLFCLSGSGKKINEVRNTHFAPKNYGQLTHIRAQVIMDTEEAAGRDLFTDVPQGQQMVFGLYGCSGDNETYHLYSYHGTLNDCPVHKANPGFRNRIDLIPDQEFIDRLHSLPHRFPSSSREKSLEAWKGHVATWFDMANIEQQLAYQLKSGAEGDSHYFEVKPRAGVKYSAAIFYEHLAPQLLTDVMRHHGEEDEWGIEDTIHQKARQVVIARTKSENNRLQLEQTKRLLGEFQRLGVSSEELNAAAKQQQKHHLELATELAVLKNIVVDQPIPGLPPRLPEGLPALAGYLVMYEGTPYLQDRAFELFTGEEPKRINERANRNNILSADVTKSQLLEITCDHGDCSSVRIQGGGPVNKYYSHESVISLVKHTDNFLPGNNHDSVSDAINKSFAWATEHADTNPARLQKRDVDVRLASLSNEDKRLSDEKIALSEESISLLKEQQQIGEHQAAYRQMQQSGLFTVEEISQPTLTGEATAKALNDATKLLQTHIEQVAERKSVFGEWCQFTEECGVNVSPKEVIQRLAESAQSARERKTECENSYVELRNKSNGLRRKYEDAEKRYNSLHNQFKEAERTLPSVKKFTDIFGEEDPTGLEQRVQDELSSSARRKSDLVLKQAALIAAIEDLSLFESRFGNTPPSLWLNKQRALYEGVRRRQEKLTGEYSDFLLSLDNLERFSLAPGQYARDVTGMVGVPSRPLHTVVNGLDLDPNRKERVLTLFSALIFAPVVSSIDMAITAAGNLATGGIEFPVFIEDELTSFCRTGDISGGDGFSKSLFVGVRTRSVDCLLDPSLVEREKDRCRNSIALIDRRLELLKKAQGRLSADTVAARLAARARDAVDNDVKATNNRIEEDLATVNGDLPRLESRASRDAIEVIRELMLHQRALNSRTYEQLKEYDNLTRGQFESTKKELEECERQRDLAQEAEKKAIYAYHQAQSNKDRNESRLQRIATFMTDIEYGPEFMSQAGSIRGNLEDKFEKTKQRTSFRFDLAQKFINSGEARPKEIESRLAEIKRITPEIDDRKDTLQKEIAADRDLSLHLAKPSSEIDAIAHKLTKLYRKHRDTQIQADVKFDRHELYKSCSFIRSPSSLDNCKKGLLNIKDEVDDLGEKINDLDKKESSARQNYQSTLKYYHEEVDRITNDATLKMSLHLKDILEQAKENSTIINQILVATQKNYEQDLKANEIASAELTNEWDGMASWLSQFTQRLPSYLNLMKKVFKPEIDPVTKQITHAGFEINGEAVRIDDIEFIMGEIINEIEEFEKSQPQNRESDFRKGYQKNFRREIRDKFYQRVIVHPSIKVCMPSISQTPLLLEKKMVSAGQGVAMTLLWIVKLADFVSERERQRKTSWEMKGSARVSMKKLRNIETQFIFVDGAFSHLSDPKLIDDALKGVSKTHGRLQLIVTGHDPEYRHHNYNYFPTFICGREIDGRYMYVDNDKRIVEPGKAGSHYGAMDLIRVRSVAKPKHVEVIDGAAAS